MRSGLARVREALRWRARGLWWRLRALKARLREGAASAPRPAASPAPSTPIAVDVLFLSDGNPGPTLDALVRFTPPPSRIAVVAESPSPALETFAASQGFDLIRSADPREVPGRSPFVAAVGPGVRVTKGWLEPLAAALEGDTTASAAIPWTEVDAPPFADRWRPAMSAGGPVHPRGADRSSECLVMRRSTFDGSGLRSTLARVRGGDGVTLVEEALVLGGDSVVASTKGDRRLAGLAIRRRALEERARLVREGLERFEGRSVLFVLPVADRGGGANVVLSEAKAMAAMGVDARVLNIAALRPYFERSYPDPGVPMLWAYPGEIPRAARRFDAVVATANTSVPWIAPLAGTGPTLGYYVQDFEPWFYQEGSAERRAAMDSYRAISGMRLVTKTEWNRELVARETGATATVIGPSYDADLFRPRLPSPPASPLRIAAMIRPASPRRAPERTLRALSHVVAELGKRAEVLTFGVAAEDPEYRALSRAFPHEHLGVLDDRALAALFGSVHVFADLSDFQAMGLTALEAMGCGATAVLPSAGGASSFAADGENALLVDTRTEEPAVQALLRLANEPELLRSLTSSALDVGRRFSVESCALGTLKALFADA